jgi:hypothetical protein
MVRATFWAIFFTNSSGHPVPEKQEKKMKLCCRKSGPGDLKARRTLTTGANTTIHRRVDTDVVELDSTVTNFVLCFTGGYVACLNYSTSGLEEKLNVI